MCHNFTNFHLVFIYFSPNGSNRNEGYAYVKIYILNEKKMGEKEDQKFTTLRSLRNLRNLRNREQIGAIVYSMSHHLVTYLIN